MGESACQEGTTLMCGGRTLSVAIVDDHPVAREGFVASLRRLAPEIVRVHSARSVPPLLTVCDIDVVVLDLDLGPDAVTAPEQNVLALVRRGYKVLIYTQETRPAVLAACINAGALGLISKGEPMSSLVEGIRTVARGEPVLNCDWAAAVRLEDQRMPRLAPREREALALYASGLPLKSVATRMDVSSETVKEYLSRIRRKYSLAGREAHTRTELYQRAVEDRLVAPPGN